MSTENQNAGAVEDPAMIDAPQWGDPSGKGILATMADLDFENDHGREIVVPSNEPEKKVEAKAEPEKKDPPAKAEPEKKEETKETVDEVVMEEDFFSKDEPEKNEADTEQKQEGFNEAEFEAETEKLSAGLEGNAGEKFKALRGELKLARKELASAAPSAEVTKELEELRLKAQEIDGLKKRNQELANVSARTRMEEDPKYKAEVVAPAGALFERADILAEAYKTDPAVLRAIIKETDRAKQNALVKEHLSEYSELDRADVFRFAQDFRGLVAKRESLLNNAETELQKAEAERVTENNRILSELRTTTQTLQGDLWTKYRDVIPGFMEDGKETALYREMKAKGLAIDFSTSRAKDQAFAAFAGTVLPHAMKQITELKKQLAARDKADKDTLAGRPKLETVNKDNDKKEQKPKTLLEASNSYGTLG